MRVCLDSSALAKRYVAEIGSDRVAARCAGADEVILSVLCLPELVSAFNRLRRERRLSAKRYRRFKRDLASDVAQAVVIDVTPAVIERSIRCLEAMPLRALDALHLACALESRCELFLTADARQAEAARAFKLTVETVGNAQ